MHLGPSAGQWLRPPGASRAARGSGECGRRGWSSRRRGGGRAACAAECASLARDGCRGAGHGGRRGAAWHSRKREHRKGQLKVTGQIVYGPPSTGPGWVTPSEVRDESGK